MANTNMWTTSNGEQLLAGYAQFVTYWQTDVPNWCAQLDVVTNAGL